MTDFTDRMAVLRERFLSRAETEAAELAQALQRRDLEAIRFISHRLAGISGVFGYPDLGTAASEVEDALDWGAPLPALEQACDRLMEQLRAALDPGR